MQERSFENKKHTVMYMIHFILFISERLMSFICILLKSSKQLVILEVMFCIGLLRNLIICFKAENLDMILFSSCMKS